MRTVFAFPAGGRAETIALLERHSPDRRDPWLIYDSLYIEIVEARSGSLYLDWDAESLAALDAAIGERPDWALQIDVSGRIDGTDEVHRILTLVLEHGGVAFDDYTDHAWTLPEIQTGVTVDGLSFFDFRGYRGSRSGTEADN